MRLISTAADMLVASRAARRNNVRSIGFVPTMGALHRGHLSLVREARARCNAVVVSIFVNPLQFGPNEDFAKYPRQFELDSKMLEAEGVDFLFAPNAQEIYAPDHTTYVAVEGLTDKLDGRSRPGHFRGVSTVVAKFFSIVQPDLAFFGQKDAAQVAILKRMVRDLNMPVRIVVCPTVRETDGVAMSSRNSYLDPQQRRSAGILFRTLCRIEDQIRQGELRSAALIEAGKKVFDTEPGVRLDYLEIVDPDTLEAVENVSGALVAIAAFVGATRLIDNVVVLPRS